ncbi:GMC family oxidoreductase [Yinghuangia seranimata]|uniref:GMC family oxidoreductase n=1 Tax=Yinghuangia seranimata TaxID=408067 RepID=UPI00248BA0AF|nr:GMC oxidoreductase [Yinghuangia seranimata]MDI2128975.1 GMC family oxidoreductase N-terminal domain-containing protein [Yinghuangia seranimata]
MAYDVVVVGAGSAGCVLAARLSEDERRSVLLVEAGPDYPSVADLPADVADGTRPTVAHDWGFVSEPDEAGRSVPLPRARLVGGCSATNAAFLLRGWPADYDAWAAAGNPGWSFAELLPVFRAVEADADFADRWHGGDGPIPVRRPSPQELSPLQHAFVRAAETAGHAVVEDHNRPGAAGIGPMPRNVRDGLRMSTSLTHLAAARDRSGLTVRADAVVDRVELSGTRACGVRLVGGAVVEAARVVLAAGSYGSPAILWRSGVGPADRLRALGLPVALDLPGVGANLADHPLVAVDLPTAPGFRGPVFQALLTMRSARAPRDGPPDLHLFAAGPFDDAASPTGGVFGIVTGLMAPRSRGSVRLRSADPTEAPLIDVAHLRHPDDLARMVDATLEARRLSRTLPLAGFVDGPELAPGAAIGDEDRSAIAASVRDRVGSYHHPVGTCAMGPDPRRGAVVDRRCAVHGAQGLWVADASVMPAIPSANTNLTAVVIAERVAVWLAAV